MVFQSYALFPHMTARRNVEFPLLMRRVDQARMRERVDRALDLVGLGAVAHHHPRQLSGGQQQRVALARALVFEPGLLLLDEPLGALDKNLREQMQVEIKRIQREIGITTIYVTHDQTEAMTMSDRVVVFNRGRVEQSAPPLDVYTRPATRFVAEFLGDSNVLEGIALPGGVRVDALSGTMEAGERAPAPGARVDLLIRPECIRVLASAMEGHTAFTMKVASVTHFGESVLLTGVVGAQRLRVRVPGSRVAAREGGEVLVGWRPDDVHVIGGPLSPPGRGEGEGGEGEGVRHRSS